MKNTEEKVVAVIMVGGPTKGTRFRPLSFNTPKPLFPLAGQPMVHHPISACKSIPNLARIFLVGFHEEREFALYVSSISSELNIPVRYLKEDKPHGSAGGLYYFKDLIMEDNPSHIVLLNCDVCCSFPLPQMLDAHRSYGGMGTLLVIKVSAESASELSKKGTENHHLHQVTFFKIIVEIILVCTAESAQFLVNGLKLLLVSQEIRTTAMSCIEGLSTLWPHVSKSGGKNGRSAVWSHFLGDVLAMMVQQKKLILSDRDFLSEFFTTLLRSGHHSLLVPQSVGESFDQPKKDSIMKFILSSALLLCPYGVVFWI